MVLRLYARRYAGARPVCIDRGEGRKITASVKTWVNECNLAYFIGPLRDCDLQLQTEELLQQLRARYPVTLQSDEYSYGYLLNWELEIKGRPNYGGLHTDRQLIDLDDDPEAAAEFAVWYRTQIPSRYKLCIFHDSSDQVFEITPIITEEELLLQLYSD